MVETHTFKIQDVRRNLKRVIFLLPLTHFYNMNLAFKLEKINF